MDSLSHNQISTSTDYEHLHQKNNINHISLSLSDRYLSHIIPPITPIIEHCHIERAQLHFFPCTLSELYRLDCHSKDRYELVDGILALKPRMVDNEHSSIVNSLRELMTIAAEKIDDDIVTLIGQGVTIHKGDIHGIEMVTKRTKRLTRASKIKTSLPQTESQDESTTRREPDITVHNWQDNSDSSLSPPHKRAKCRQVSDKVPVMVVEVTSLNRETDLYQKKEEYERARINQYVIVDRMKGKKNEEQKVIVFNYRSGRYNRQEFTSSDIVHCRYFDYFGLTAEQMFDHKYLRKLVKMEQLKRAKAVEERNELAILTEVQNGTIQRQGEKIEDLGESNRKKDEKIKEQNRELKRLRALSSSKTTKRSASRSSTLPSPESSRESEKDSPR